MTGVTGAALNDNPVYALQIENRSESDLHRTCEATKTVAKKAQASAGF